MTKNWFKPSSNKPSHELVMRHIYLSVYNGMHSIIPLGFVYLLLYRKCLFTYIYHLSPKKNSRKCFVTRTFQTYLGTKEWKDIWRRHGMKNKEEERQKKKQKKRKRDSLLLVEEGRRSNPSPASRDLQLRTRTYPCACWSNRK